MCYGSKKGVWLLITEIDTFTVLCDKIVNQAIYIARYTKLGISPAIFPVLSSASDSYPLCPSNLDFQLLIVVSVLSLHVVLGFPDFDLLCVTFKLSDTMSSQSYHCQSDMLWHIWCHPFLCPTPQPWSPQGLCWPSSIGWSRMNTWFVVSAYKISSHCILD